MGTNENLTKQRAAMTHELKIWPKHIEDLDSGRKTFEIRSTKDRDFRPGDELLLNEYLPKERVYTGRQLRTKILGVHEDVDGLEPDFAILSLDTVQRTGSQWIEGSERVGRAEGSLTSHITQADLDLVKPLFFPKLPGSEGLAEKVQEITKGPSIRIPPPPIPDLHDAVNKMRGVDRVQELASRMVLDEAKLHDSATIECLRRHGYMVLKTEEAEALRDLAYAVQIPPNGTNRILDLHWSDARKAKDRLVAIRATKEAP